MLTDPEVRLETQIVAMENMQAVRLANWFAEKARIETKLASREAAWLVEQTGRAAKIEALRGKLLGKREARFARETERETLIAEIRESAERHARFLAAFTPEAD